MTGFWYSMTPARRTRLPAQGGLKRRNRVLDFFQMHRAKFGCVFTASVVLVSPLAHAARGAVVFASSVGAHLDSDLLKGGGTDDTQVLQAVLDRAIRGKPVDLIIDGPALVAGLNVYGNTIV